MPKTTNIGKQDNVLTEIGGSTWSFHLQILAVEVITVCLVRKSNWWKKSFFFPASHHQIKQRDVTK